MGQVTIYLDNEIENKMKTAAKSSHLSVSKWISQIIKDKVSTEWPQDIIDLAGSWKSDFKGTPIDPYDTLIAGTALQNNAILITHNTKEFRRVKGLIIEDWY